MRSALLDLLALFMYVALATITANNFMNTIIADENEIVVCTKGDLWYEIPIMTILTAFLIWRFPSMVRKLIAGYKEEP